jgi:hypothetical protein
VLRLNRPKVQTAEWNVLPFDFKICLEATGVAIVGHRQLDRGQPHHNPNSTDFPSGCIGLGRLVFVPVLPLFASMAANLGLVVLVQRGKTLSWH